MDVTIRGLHSTYGGAVNHFKASVRKHGVVDAFVVKPVDPQMTFEIRPTPEEQVGRTSVAMARGPGNRVKPQSPSQVGE